jgi:hypothetical protein
VSNPDEGSEAGTKGRAFLVSTPDGLPPEFDFPGTGTLHDGGTWEPADGVTYEDIGWIEEDGLTYRPEAGAVFASPALRLTRPALTPETLAALGEVARTWAAIRTEFAARLAPQLALFNEAVRRAVAAVKDAQERDERDGPNPPR